MASIAVASDFDSAIRRFDPSRPSVRDLDRSEGRSPPGYIRPDGTTAPEEVRNKPK